MVYPLDTRGGSNAITIISNGMAAHSTNHHTGLRPFLLAIMLPTMPAIMSSKTYLTMDILITRLFLLYITYANKWYSATTCNLGEYPIPFVYGLEIGLYLSKLYKVR